MVAARAVGTLTSETSKLELKKELKEKLSQFSYNDHNLRSKRSSTYKEVKIENGDETGDSDSNNVRRVKLEADSGETSRFFKRERSISPHPQLDNNTKILNKKKPRTRVTTKKSKKSNSIITTNTAKEPNNWRKIYDMVSVMRSKAPAAVDHMGCQKLPEFISGPDILLPENAPHLRFQALISLMLSAQTKDEVNAKAMTNLHDCAVERGYKFLTIDFIREIEVGELNELIYQVGFHNRKAVFIKKTADILESTYNSDIPDTIEELIALPGVGPKMGYLLLQIAWGKVEGVGVDVHVHRLTNLWGWVNTKTPEQTRAALESWLPKELWADINPLLVGFGQSICLPRGSKCNLCTLSVSGLCGGVNRKLINKTKTESDVLKDIDNYF